MVCNYGSGSLSLSLSLTNQTNGRRRTRPDRPIERPTYLTERGYYAVSYHSGNNIPSRAEQSRAKIREGRRDVAGLILIRAADPIFSNKGVLQYMCDLVSGWVIRMSFSANKLDCCL